MVYRKPTQTDQYLHCSSNYQTSFKEITNKDDLHKENARIKQALRENGYQESIINKIFWIISNDHSLPQSQQLTQAADIQEEDIRMSINLPYVEGTSKKLRPILRSHKIRSTFCTELTLRKLLCKPKDRVATEDNNFNWDQKKVIDRESRFIPRKMKETIHFLKNPNHINKISYLLSEILLPNLR